MIRQPSDYYPTPAWCVHRLFDEVDLPGGVWLEPAVGDGAIVRAVSRDDVRWVTCDVRDVESNHHGSFLRWRAAPRAAVIMTNPPFKLAEAFVARSLELAPVVVMLLRLGWLASARRHELLRAHTPSIAVLPQRPSFVGSGTDLHDYAWFLWGVDPVPTVRILDLTSQEDRRGRKNDVQGSLFR